MVTREDQFYLTLLSNSSMSVYPNNTTAKFTTHLPRHMQLTGGDWEAALVEFHYPCTYQMFDNDSTITIEAEEEEIDDALYTPEPSDTVVTKPLESDSLTKQQTFEIPIVKKGDPSTLIVMPEDKNIEDDDLPLPGENEHLSEPQESIPPVDTAHKPSKYRNVTFTVKVKGFFNDMHEFNEHVNKIPGLAKYVLFAYNKELRRMQIAPTSFVKSIRLSPKLNVQLGYDPNEGNIRFKTTAPRAPNVRLGFDTQIFVYCDIVRPQIVGDTMTPLLRFISVDNSKYVFGTYRVYVPTMPHYVPLLKTTFDNVEIDIRTVTGQPLPFLFGTSCVKLHLRRVRHPLLDITHSLNRQ